MIFFFKKPQAINFHFLSNPRQGMSGDDKTVNRSSGYFFRPMSWFRGGVPALILVSPRAV